MTRPNLFDFATSELSQDAFICWLASWADPAFRDSDRPLHAAATRFLGRLLEVGTGPRVGEYRSVEVCRQWKKIDVLLVVNGDTAIIIEDKTAARDHSGQLDRYKAAVRTRFAADRIAAVYLKTGDQGNYDTVDRAGYGRFLRRDFLAVLDHGEAAGVTNHIFADFHARLRRVEAAVQGFRSVRVDAWDSHCWSGFFLALQQALGEGNWKYVPNKRGGFMGFWWHWRGDKYLQLEWAKLCFKVSVPDPARQTAEWLAWHQALSGHDGANGIRLKRSTQEGDSMTVATAAGGDYLRTDAAGRLDLERTVRVLRDAELFLDAAAGVACGSAAVQA